MDEEREGLLPCTGIQPAGEALGPCTVSWQSHVCHHWAPACAARALGPRPPRDHSALVSPVFQSAQIAFFN